MKSRIKAPKLFGVSLERAARHSDSFVGSIRGCGVHIQHVVSVFGAYRAELSPSESVFENNDLEALIADLEPAILRFIGMKSWSVAQEYGHRRLKLAEERREADPVLDALKLERNALEHRARRDKDPNARIE